MIFNVKRCGYQRLYKREISSTLMSWYDTTNQGNPLRPHTLNATLRIRTTTPCIQSLCKTSRCQTQEVRALPTSPRRAANHEEEDHAILNFERIPNELKLMVADCLNLFDTSSLGRTSRALYALLTEYRYRRAKDLKNKYGRPYFLLAVDSGDLSAVKQFIEVGTSVNMCDTVDDKLPTALHSCVKRGNIDIAQLLIQNRVNMSAENKEGWTPLYCAAGRFRPPREAMVRVLLDAGPPILASSKFEETILYTATVFGTASIVKLLLQRGEIPIPSEHNGATLLHCAATLATGATVRVLFESGLDIEATTVLGETPLHCAASFNKKDTVDVLLQSGANVHAIDLIGFTPLQTFFEWRPSDSAAHRILHHEALPEGCSWKGIEECVPACRFVNFNEPVVDLLLSAGANIWACSNSTRSAFDGATDWVNNHRGLQPLDSRRGIV
jgi:ankyrin repeat protein